MSQASTRSPSHARPWWLASRQLAPLVRQHRHLLLQLSWRDVQARYRGSWLGLVWSLLNPLLMLGLYTFVFAVVFQARWNDQTPQSDVDFALALFSGWPTPAT
jgi:ABC-type polysaccharide/polyol phosphate export permease